MEAGYDFAAVHMCITYTSYGMHVRLNGRRLKARGGPRNPNVKL